MARFEVIDRSWHLGGGVVDDDVQTTQLSHGLLDGSSDRVEVAHVKAYRYRAAASVIDLLRDRVDRAGESLVLLLLGPGRDRNGGAGPGQILRDIGTDPAARAGHERDAASQAVAERHRLSPRAAVSNREPVFWTGPSLAGRTEPVPGL